MNPFRHWLYRTPPAGLAASPPRRFRPALDALDGRAVPAILWANRAAAQASFASALGGSTNAAAATAIVNQAIADWNSVVTSFNYSDAGRTDFNLYFSAGAFADTSTRGSAGVNYDSTYFELSSRKPIRGDIQIDDNGGGQTWFFDPTPATSTEFTDAVTRYEGAKPGGAADLYRTVAHEIGHALGIVTDTRYGPVQFRPKIVDSQSYDSTTGRYGFLAGTTTATFTADGHLFSGGSSPYTNYFLADGSVNDLMNPGSEVPGGATTVTTRQFISPLDLNILRDGYGYSVNAGGLKAFAPRADKVGAFNPSASGSEFRFRNPDGSQTTYNFGGAGWTPLAGDWNGDGKDTPGVYSPSNGTGGNGVFVFLNENLSQTFIQFGGAGGTPVVGDWDGDGTDTPGVFYASTGKFYLYNPPTSSTGGVVTQTVVTFGGAGWTAIAGDWNGDGVDEVGVYSPTAGTGGNGQYRLYNRNNTQTFIDFAGAGYVPVVGDWDGDGTDNIGAFSPGLATNQFALLNGNGTQTFYTFGGPGWSPLAGNWNL